MRVQGECSPGALGTAPSFVSRCKQEGRRALPFTTFFLWDVLPPGTETGLRMLPSPGVQPFGLLS